MAREQHAPARFDVREPALQPANGVALYAQLAELFRYNIVSHKWPGGQRLNNFEELAAQYSVARITVRQAVALLVQEGLLSTQRGRGTFVLSAAAELPPAADGGGSTDEKLEMEILFSARSTRLPPEFLGELEAFDAYRELTKLHRLNGAPFAMVRSYVAEHIYQRFARGAVGREKLLRLTLKHAGRAAEHMRQRMTIELADLVLSQHLGCGVGAPVAKIARQTFGATRRLSYTGIAWYRGDAFEMDMTLPRALIQDSSPALIAPASRSTGDK
jgi:GntR family transcriptional regulator